MRRKHKDFKKLMGYSMTMGATGLIGGKLPAPAAAPVVKVAQAGSPYVAPMASATGAGAVVRVLRDLKPKRQKGRLK